MAVKWTKELAVSEQLDAAIYCLAREQFIAAHTLSAAVLEVAERIAAANGLPTGYGTLNDLISEKFASRAKEFRIAMRKPQNYAKHADRDYGEEIEVRPELTINYIGAACSDVTAATNKRTLVQAVFMMWLCLWKPDALPTNQRHMNTLFRAAVGGVGDIEGFPLSEALASLRELLARLDSTPDAKAGPFQVDTAELIRQTSDFRRGLGLK